ncbi:thioredoxin [Cotonvirus japonicus]|uniref:Thioredoxin n=1 Tax=Cotonvirus japonicus TaxID=2811091 RepID=A0ABM7NTE9_9VIRU|nr:thioredoxin [Cotonvirus japonicus]BCS83347.1 thioredoxin [Cotonvirus japonicus]
MVKELTNLEEFSEAIGNEKTGLVVVDFFTTWCNPCKKIAPMYESMSEKYTNIHFYKINAENPSLQNITEACEIISLPTFCLFKSGKYITRFVNADPVGLEKIILENM